MIHFLPIEPLWQRYSEQWLGWFQREFQVRNVPSTTYMGDAVGDIGTGQFLDVYGTHVFKFTQLARLINATSKGRGIKDGDTVFLMDVWFPGLEALAYMRQGAGLNFKIAGILHDGTYNPADFLAQRGMGTWGEPLENCWFEILDEIFVATNFHRDAVLKARRCQAGKIHVTGLPFYVDAVDYSSPHLARRHQVCFPHRIAPEKAPEKFDQLLAFSELSGWRRYNHEPALPKSDYYSKMAQTEVAVSYAQQEMFGIAMLEACANGCLPLVPDRLSYAEMYPDVFKYQPAEEHDLGPRIKDLIARRRELEPLARSIPRRYEMSVAKMLEVMRHA